MRKITLNPRIADSTSFDWNNDWIVIKENDQLLEFSAPKRDNPYRKYTRQQQEVIQTVNHVLEHNNQPVVSIEEADRLLFPLVKIKKSILKIFKLLPALRLKRKLCH